MWRRAAVRPPFSMPSGLLADAEDGSRVARADPRKDVLRERNVRGCFAIFRDGAVYEFGQAARMEGEPEQLIKSIGGSTGVLKAATVSGALGLERRARLPLLMRWPDCAGDPPPDAQPLDGRTPPVARFSFSFSCVRPGRPSKLWCAWANSQRRTRPARTSRRDTESCAAEGAVCR
jgi:hypothetical protein